MRNQKIKYWISLLLLLLFFITTISGLVIWLLPYGSNVSKIEFIGIFKYQWKMIHVWGGLLLLIFVIIHFIDHWNWMIRMTKKILKKNND